MDCLSLIDNRVAANNFLHRTSIITWYPNGLVKFVCCFEDMSKYYNINNDINRNFIFRFGELHVVFAFLKVIGKYIENSGLDEIFIESNIYGPNTLNQILQGKHMNRAVEAYMLLYLTLYDPYINNLFENNTDLEK